MKGDPTFVVSLHPSDLGPTQSATALNTDALRTGSLRGLDCALHRPSKRDPVPDLVGHVLRHQPRVQLGTLDFLDVHGHLRVRQDTQLVTELVDLRSTLSDDHAGPGRMHCHDDLGRLALDIDCGDRGVREAPLQVASNCLVFLKKSRKVLLGVPL